MGAHSEWAPYGMDVVTWLLMLVGDGKCSSWVAADVRLVVSARAWR